MTPSIVGSILGVQVTRASRRKQPAWMAVGDPEGAQHGQRAGWERHIAILVAFTGLNVQLHARAVDLGDGEVSAFMHTQATGVDGAQASAVACQPKVAQDAPNLLHAQHNRERLRRAWANEVEDREGLAQGVLEQELDGAERHPLGRGSHVFLGVEIEEILAEFFLGEAIGGIWQSAQPIVGRRGDR
jgi:hypothetical protein